MTPPAPLAAHQTPNTLISYETTLPVGTLRGRQAHDRGDQREGHRLHLVFSPEWVLTGRVFDLRRYPRARGRPGFGASLRRHRLLKSVLDFDERRPAPPQRRVWDIGTASPPRWREAFVETTYRDVNIGLANQFAVYADKAGFDIEPRHRGLQLPALLPYPPPHGVAVGGRHHLPRLYLSTDPDASVVPPNATMPLTWWAGPPGARLAGGLRVVV